MCEVCTTRTVDRRTAIGGALALGAVGAFVAAAGTRPTRAHAQVATVPVTADLSIAPRDAWADEPPKWEMLPEDVRFLLIHHTAGRQPAPEDVAAELRSIYRFHTGPEKLWPDVCYNFFVDPYGGVWEGRAGSLAGPVEASATGGSQGFAQLVCLLGDFTSVMPTEAAVDSLVRTLAWLAGRYGIDTHPEATTSFLSRGSNKWPEGASVVSGTVCGHRDMTYTACPGDTFYPYVVADLRKRVYEGATPATTAPAATTTRPVATTESTLPTPGTSPTPGASSTSSLAPAAASGTPSSGSSAGVLPTTQPLTPSPQPGPDGGGTSDPGPGQPLVAGAVATAVVGGAALFAWRSRKTSARATPSVAPEESA